MPVTRHKRSTNKNKGYSIANQALGRLPAGSATAIAAKKAAQAEATKKETDSNAEKEKVDAEAAKNKVDAKDKHNAETKANKTADDKKETDNGKKPEQQKVNRKGPDDTNITLASIGVDIGKLTNASPKTPSFVNQRLSRATKKRLVREYKLALEASGKKSKLKTADKGNHNKQSESNDALTKKVKKKFLSGKYKFNDDGDLLTSLIMDPKEKTAATVMWGRHKKNRATSKCR